MRGRRLSRPQPARSRGARPVGRSGTGTLLAAYCKRHTGAERRYVGGYSIWIHGSATRNETRKFLESWPLSFLRAGPPKSRKKAGESRTHPNLETNFAKLRPGQASARGSNKTGPQREQWIRVGCIRGGNKHTRMVRLAREATQALEGRRSKR